MPVLVVLKAHPYESKQRAVGTEYSATESDARLLVLSGQARYKKKEKQTYETRDLVAGSTPRGTKGLIA